MKALLKIAACLAVGSIALLAMAGLLDAMSLNPRYELREAVVVNVQDDPAWGYIGEDKRTLVRFADGYRDYVPGAIGEPGDAVMVGRQCGTMSMFGWTGDTRW